MTEPTHVELEWAKGRNEGKRANANALEKDTAAFIPAVAVALCACDMASNERRRLEWR